jgi:bisphosphoglycerate-dependent phosphoglycerate mutase
MQFRLHTFDAVYMSILQRTTKTYDLMAEEFAKYVVPRNTHPSCRAQ